ncbi:MAG: hypothetical protein AAGD07_23600, partial [Planctomycetota bacterium]
GMGGGMGGGMFRVAPGRAQKVTLTTVCLEHDKPEPNPRMEYKIVRLDEVTQDPAVHLLCGAVGRGQVAQNTAQAAAWHLMDKMSWEELSRKNRVESKYRGNIRFFSPLELRAAMTVVAECSRMAQDQSMGSQSESADHPAS